MKIVEVWPRGYAHQDGTKRLVVGTFDDVHRAVTEAFGSLASISSIRDDAPPREISPPSEEYARMMSRHDNS